MAKVKRKTFAARADLLDQLSEVAKRRGSTLYSLINQLLELALEADGKGVDLKRIFEEHETIETVKNSSFILIPEVLWHDLVEDAYETSREKVLKRYYEAGRWIAKRYVSSSIDDPFQAFKMVMEASLWNVNEFNLERRGDSVDVWLLSPRWSKAHIEAYASLMTGALETFGYKITSREAIAGSLRMRAQRR